MMWSQFILILVFIVSSNGTEHKVKNEAGTLPNLELDWEDDYALGHSEPKFERTLLASTLDGSLVAIHQQTGEILWKLDDQPVVRSPYDAANPVLPAFLPDPKDGSLYMIGRGLKEPLKKLPFTIPELVAASPCKSSDGILYTGKKVDTWFSVDRLTGSKQGSLTFNGCVKDDGDSCPNLGPANFLVGRTEYNIMMYDSRVAGRKWNITYFDYSSNLASTEAQHDYNYAHFSDSSRGDLVTIDRKSGTLEWKVEIGSPIVALFRVEGDGIINTMFTSVSQETLSNLITHFDDEMTELNDNQQQTKNLKDTKFFATLYVGEYEHGLYAMPSLVDEETLTISPASNGPLLLEGPQNFEMPQNSEISLSGITDTKNDDPFGIPLDAADAVAESKGSILLFGYYQIPSHSTIKLSPAMTSLRLTSTSSGKAPAPSGFSDKILPTFPHLYPPYPGSNQQKVPLLENENLTKITEAQASTIDWEILSQGLEALKSFNTTFFFSQQGWNFFTEALKVANHQVAQVENKELKLIVILLCLGLIVLYKIAVKNQFQNQYQGSFRMSNSSVGSNGSQVLEVTALPMELENGHIKVGNITFNPGHILGKGCEGTFVYKGKFDARDVAVKRVLAACFTIADREVELLRESDEHPNVIRYFCMEQDRQFRYIALEYCCATLHDFVTGKYEGDFKLEPLTILRQATQGLAHLHSLDIVHRDVKPHNVLISMPGKKGEVRAMISDFGLCKKLKVGRMSFSHRSGIAGTEGWIAPELMLGNRSTTCAVDVFSLGCVYYFVLSDGHHPFGESFKRQANILSGESNLSHLSRNYPALNLLEKMIMAEPSLRPPASAVLKHPLFWSKEKTLTFLQDVSDRVDKEDTDSVVLAALERRRSEIANGNWLQSLDEHVQEDLKKHRTYKGSSVRDLLRALRNKRHHYNELSEVTKLMYGRIPDQFVDYWTSRFPQLLTHSWTSMHCIKNEPTFIKYFDKDYDFVKQLAKEASSGNNNDTTFYREEQQQKSILKPTPTKKQKDNLFMPNFTLNNDDEEEDVSQKDSVISQWDNLPTDDLENNHENDDDEFSEMKPVAPVTPVRKVVGQLKSQFEESKRPETWAKAVQGLKSVPVVPPSLDKLDTSCDILSVQNEENEDQNKVVESEPVWILPPVEDKPKKKNKKKKKLMRED